jgi:DNA-binding transcriptional LysR family regulator
MMELRQLRHFAAVAQHGNFTRAAKVLNLSQPALSRQVKNLEQELGLALMKRSKNGVSLTPAGKLFWGEVGDLVAQLDQVAERVKKQCRGGRIRAGAFPPFVAGVMPEVLNRFRAADAGPSPELFDLTVQETISRANAGELDIAFVPRELESSIPNFQWTSFRVIQFLLVVSRQHPLAASPSVSPMVLKNYRLHGLSHTSFPEYEIRLRSMLRPYHLRPRFEDQSSDGVHALFTALEAHNGISVLCEGVTHMMPNSLVAVPFDHPLPPIAIGVGLARTPNSGHTEAFVRVCHSVAG